MILFAFKLIKIRLKMNGIVLGPNLKEPAVAVMGVHQFWATGTPRPRLISFIKHEKITLHRPTPSLPRVPIRAYGHGHGRGHGHGKFILTTEEE
jgi:hypothetical protein